MICFAYFFGLLDINHSHGQIANNKTLLVLNDYCICISIHIYFVPFFLCHINARPNQQTRCFFYMVMTALTECEVAQKLGICIISYCSGFDKWNSTAIKSLVDAMQFTGSACQSVPCRITSFRVCYDDPRLQFFINAMKYALGQFTSLRVRTHLGKYHVLILLFF